MDIHYFSLNEQGGRKNVEDAIMPVKYLVNDVPVFVLCDGVGGNSFGEVASEYAVKNFYKIFKDNYKNIPVQLNSLIEQALSGFKNDLEIFINGNPGAFNSSTTLTIFIIIYHNAYFIWSGDSRIYHIRKGKILYRTKDHSLVAQLVASGEITEEEAATHSKKNVITRCLNSGTQFSDIETMKISNIQPGDWIMSCTDGLLEHFTEKKLESLFKTFDKNKNYSAEIHKICEGRTGDNYSMQLVHIKDKKNKGKTSWMIWILPFLLIGLLWFGYNFYTNSKIRNIEKNNNIKEVVNQPEMNSADVLPTIIEDHKSAGNSIRYRKKDSSVHVPKKINIK